MTALTKLAALGSASIAAASVAWVVSASRSGDGAQQKSTNKSVFCAGEDRVLRVVDAKSCPDRDRLDLAEADGNTEPPEWDDVGPAGPEGPTKRDAPGSGRLAELERRVRALEERPLFEVVDKAGRPIFRVAPETVLVYNREQVAVAAIRATADGGYFIGRSTTNGLAASIGASGARSGVRISENGVTRADLGKQEQGNHALRFPSPARGIIAGIGESRAGTGALIVGNAGGTLLASMTGSDGKGAIGVSNGSGAPVVSLSEGATRGGLLSIGDATSEPMVKMGVAQDRYGIVLTGPRAGFPLIPSSGLPGSYIMGCAGKGKDCGPEPSMGR